MPSELKKEVEVIFVGAGRGNKVEKVDPPIQLEEKGARGTNVGTGGKFGVLGCRVIDESRQRALYILALYAFSIDTPAPPDHDKMAEFLLKEARGKGELQTDSIETSGGIIRNLRELMLRLLEATDDEIEKIAASDDEIKYGSIAMERVGFRDAPDTYEEQQQEKIEILKILRDYARRIKGASGM